MSTVHMNSVKKYIMRGERGSQALRVPPLIYVTDFKNSYRYLHLVAKGAGTPFSDYLRKR